MATVAIGKAKIDIRARGCVLCGAENSHNWRLHGLVTINVKIAKRTIVRHVEIYVCGHCDGIPAFGDPQRKEWEKQHGVNASSRR